ncbi:MAG: mannitol dehydrogenase family protein [Treponema sp.]|jgi:mannitol-1-phosphate/altronate dehydrogenase|nr:mannitol dehydrogenase family protein [Treponema sp.]
MEAVKLNQDNLARIGTPVLIPAYKRDGVKPGIVHLGLGHFHRAHQALYLEILLNKGITRAGLFEINLIKDPFPLAKIAGEQDYLYTLLTKSKDGAESVQIVGSIRGYINASENIAPAIARIAGAEISVVTMTITEKGYYWDAALGDLDWNAGALVHDLTHPAEPQSAAGVIAAALKLRYDAGGLPLSILSCDNFAANGKVLRSSVLSFCRRVYPEIASWVEDKISFPCSMVDRITPNTAAETIRYLEKQYGIVDTWAVCCEDYLQWVLEDSFSLPPNAAFDPRCYAEAGVQLVKDVEPYELMKQGLLNGSHSALAYLAYLLGYADVAAAMEDSDLRSFIRSSYMEEVTPTLLPVEGIDLSNYKDTLINRFSNRNIGDTILRLAEDGSKKIPLFILKPLTRAVHAGKPCGALILALSGWARFLDGTDENGKPIPIKDPDGVSVIAAAQKARENPGAFLRAAGVQGLNENDLARLEENFKSYLEQIWRQGTRNTLLEFLRHREKNAGSRP